MKIFDNISPVELKWVKVVHDVQYISKLQSALPKDDKVIKHTTMSPQEMKMLQLNSAASIVRDTFGSGGSWTAALHASGAVCMAVDDVMRERQTRAFCAVRPPGHHAGRCGRTEGARSQGFCLLNNVAIGAKYAVLKHDVARVAVVDFDVHHGNGTQEILQGDENFLFVSVHVTGANFYPGTGKNDDASESNVLNVAMDGNKQRSLSQFRSAFDGVIMKRLRDFGPELILISAGFDGHKGDPVSASVLTERDYFDVTLQLCRLADEMSNCRVVSVLEGGYDIEEGALANAAEAHVLALVVPTAKQQALLDQGKRMNVEQLRAKVKAVLEGNDVSPNASPRRERSPSPALKRSPKRDKSPARQKSPARSRSPKSPLAKKKKSPPTERVDDSSSSKSSASPKSEKKRSRESKGGDVGTAFSPPLGVGEKKSRLSNKSSQEDDAEVDIVDDDAQQRERSAVALTKKRKELKSSVGKKRSSMSNEESQEGTAREGPDLEMDFEMSEKSFTEAVERHVAPPIVAKHVDDRKAFVAPKVEVKKVGVINEDDDVDMDEINALIGEELGGGGGA